MSKNTRLTLGLFASLAAEKVRKDGGSPESVELPLTVRVRALPNYGCQETCVRLGTKYAARTQHCPPSEK